jgi:hypothetical protein
MLIGVSVSPECWKNDDMLDKSQNKKYFCGPNRIGENKFKTLFSVTNRSDIATREVCVNLNVVTCRDCEEKDKEFF